jgi:hypothetical protein
MLLFLCTNLDIAKDGTTSDEKLMEASDIGRNMESMEIGKLNQWVL